MLYNRIASETFEVNVCFIQVCCHNGSISKLKFNMMLTTAAENFCTVFMFNFPADYIFKKFFWVARCCWFGLYTASCLANVCCAVYHAASFILSKSHWMIHHEANIETSDFLAGETWYSRWTIMSVILML